MIICAKTITKSIGFYILHSIMRIYFMILVWISTMTPDALIVTYNWKWKMSSKETFSSAGKYHYIVFVILFPFCSNQNCGSLWQFPALPFCKISWWSYICHVCMSIHMCVLHTPGNKQWRMECNKLSKLEVERL